MPAEFLNKMTSGILAVPASDPIGAIRIAAVDGLELSAPPTFCH